MGKINIKIKDVTWNEVMDYLEIFEKREVKTKLYYKLSKLYQIYNSALKLSRHTWFENYNTPNIAYRRKSALAAQIEDGNKLIYHYLINLDNDINNYILKLYSLSIAYNQANNDYMPSMFDKESIKTELSKKMQINIFEDEEVAMNVIKVYKELLKLQSNLKRLKSIQTNEGIEGMLKLTTYTKAQLKQIVFDLGCRLFATSTNQIEIAKCLPDGIDKTLYYIQQSGMKSLNK